MLKSRYVILNYGNQNLASYISKQERIAKESGNVHTLHEVAKLCFSKPKAVEIMYPTLVMNFLINKYNT